MKYITVIAQDTASGMACTMQDYATLAEAESRYHVELSAALVSDAIIGIMCEVVGTDGIVYRIEHADGPAKAKAAQAAEAE
ncbi:MAG: hypothetical protein PUE29_10520 [Olsenella sp.]|nr:hypothetical protein [Olsenella sp.]